MKRILAAVLALTASVAFAATWSDVSGLPSGYFKGRSGAFTSGTATSSCAAISSATAGIDLLGLDAASIDVETLTTAPTVGCKFAACVLNPVTSKWHAVPDLDLFAPSNVTTLTAWQDMEVLADVGRLAYEPSGCGTLSGTIYMYGVSGPKRR